jgi:hypothetical protein
MNKVWLFGKIAIISEIKKQQILETKGFYFA